MFEYDSGLADIRRQVPMDPGTSLMAYSMSKTITAAAVLQLVEAGKVGLEDAVDRYMGSNPYGPDVTVRQLLSHASGIPKPIPLRWVHEAARHETFDEDAALAAVLRAHPRLSSQPGTRYAYSNLGYWLLGKVVERASGEAFTDRHSAVWSAPREDSASFSRISSLHIRSSSATRRGASSMRRSRPDRGPPSR